MPYSTAAERILSLLQKKITEPWSGTMTELSAVLNAGENHPLASPSGTGECLRMLEPVLAAAGWGITYMRLGRARNRITIIEPPEADQS